MTSINAHFAWYAFGGAKIQRYATGKYTLLYKVRIQNTRLHPYKSILSVICTLSLYICTQHLHTLPFLCLKFV